jgi:hypothetical protein
MSKKVAGNAQRRPKAARNEGTAKNSVETELRNMEGLIEEARGNLDKMAAAHLLMMGETFLEIEGFLDNTRMRVLAECAATVSLDLDGLQSHVDVIRSAIRHGRDGKPAGEDDAAATSAAAEE